MIILKEPDKTIAKVLGNQKAEDKQYRMALWVVEADALLHNTLTGEVMQLDDNELHQLNDVCVATDNSDLHAELIRRYYIVPVDFDEVDYVAKWRNILQIVVLPQQKRKYTIIPTTACNARCYYCYEKDLQAYTMSDAVEEQVVANIIAKYKHSKSTTASDENADEDNVTLRWFGGEPLVGMKQIDSICSELKSKGINVSSTMISNGYLFDEEVVDKAVKLWNLKKIQITLDGTEEVYNNVKAYINPDENPFRKVVRNIQLLTEAGIKVMVRLNLGSHNYNDLKQLVSELECLKHKNLEVYCKTIFQEKSEENDRRCAELMDLLAAKELREQGRSLSKLRINACMADADNSIIINPLGDISKCEHYMFEYFGNIENGIDNLDKDKIKTWKEYSIPDTCRTCPLMPSCVHLNRCPENNPCTEFERSYRIEQTKIRMRMLEADEIRPKGQDS